MSYKCIILHFICISYWNNLYTENLRTEIVIFRRFSFALLLLLILTFFVRHMRIVQFLGYTSFAHLPVKRSYIICTSILFNNRTEKCVYRLKYTIGDIKRYYFEKIIEHNKIPSIGLY
jgi:hypothetical protein